MSLLEITDNEKGMLIHLTQERNTLEGLKKVFLRSFLRKREGDVHVKAAAGYAVDFLEEAFRELESMVEREKEKLEGRNVV